MVYIYIYFELRIQEWQTRKWSFLCVRGAWGVVSKEKGLNWEPVMCSGNAHLEHDSERQLSLGQ